MFGSVGLFDKAKALANEAVIAGKRVVDSVSEHAESFGEHGGGFGAALDKGGAGVRMGRQLAAESLEAVGESEAGRRAGSVVRQAGRVVGGLPVLSTAMDTIRASNCVDLLIENLRGSPTDKYANLWLAESLIKTSDDTRKYQVARAMVDPTSLLVTSAAKQVSMLGKDDLPAIEKLLRKAWTIASGELKSRVRSADCFDVLARVYLAKGDLRRGISASQTAILANHRDPIPRITLGRALLQSGDFSGAELAGLSAAECGSTVGYLVAAEAGQRLSGDADGKQMRARIQEYEDMVSRVSASDRTLYSGAYRSRKEIASAVRDAQVEKAGDTWSTVKRWGGIIRDA